MKMEKLNPKRAAFVREYLVDLNGTQAAIRAGYSKKTARQQADQLLSNLDVRAAVQKGQSDRSKRLEITADMVTREYAKLAFLDPRKFYDESGRLIDVHQLPAEVAAALAGMEVVVERTGFDEDGKPQFSQVRKIKFSDKKGALDSLARSLGMFVDKVDHTSSDGSMTPTVIERRIVDNASD